MKKGFTLIELLIVVAIIAILAMIALPAYQKYIDNSYTVACHTSVRALALAEITYLADEQLFTDNYSDLTKYGFAKDPHLFYSKIDLVAPTATQPATFLVSVSHKSGGKSWVWNNLPNIGISEAAGRHAADNEAVLPSK